MTSRILIVDDDELVLTGLASSLGDLGYQVITALSGPAALEQLEQEPVDAVLADMVLGEMDGLELLRRVHARHPTIPVLILTGHGTAANAVQALREGAVDYLQKPARPEEIARRLDAAIAARHLRDRLAAERELARQDATTRETRALRIERFDTAYRLVRGLGTELEPLLQLLVNIPPELVHTSSPEQREVFDRGVDRLRTLRALSMIPHDPPEVFDLRDTVAAALDAPLIHHLRAARPNVIVEVDRGSSVIRINGVPTLLRMAITSLVAAMLRALPSGGRLTIEILAEELTEPWGHLVQGASGTYGVVRLHTSVRLTDEELDHLFEPYAVESVVAGDGFALMRVLLCMRVHRGLSVVRTTPSPTGTELRLLFPLAPFLNTSTSTDKSAHPPAARPRRRVLVVDDAPHHRHHAVELLRALNCESDEAHSTSAALEKITENSGRNTPYDLVLVDLVLGEPTDGVDLLRRILELGGQCAVALMGGFADLTRIAEGRRAGAVTYLRKPLVAEALEDALEAAARIKAAQNGNPGT